MHGEYTANVNPQKVRLLSSLHLRGHYAEFMVGMLLFFMLLEWLPTFIGIAIPKDLLSYTHIIENYIKAINDNPLVSEQTRKMAVETVKNYHLPISIVVYTLIASGPLTLGNAWYQLFFLRNRRADYSTLFSGFRYLFKAILLYIIRTVIVLLLSTLFFIPGIIASYSLRQCFFILADDPTKGVFKCIAESNAMMYGNKMNAFFIDISYLLLIVFTYIPGRTLGMMGGFGDGYVGYMFYYICMTPFFLALSNLYLGRVTFYEVLRSHGFENFEYEGEDIFREGIPVFPNTKD